MPNPNVPPPFENGEGSILDDEGTTEANTALVKEIVAQGAKIIKLVKAGRLLLSRSFVIGDRLFVYAGDWFYVLGTKEGIEQADHADPQAKTWPFAGRYRLLVELKTSLLDWEKDAD